MIERDICTVVNGFFFQALSPKQEDVTERRNNFGRRCWKFTGDRVRYPVPFSQFSWSYNYEYNKDDIQGFGRIPATHGSAGLSVHMYQLSYADRKQWLSVRLKNLYIRSQSRSPTVMVNQTWFQLLRDLSISTYLYLQTVILLSPYTGRHWLSDNSVTRQDTWKTQPNTFLPIAFRQLTKYWTNS